MIFFFLPQLTVHGDRVQLDVINPKREKSGTYKVVMKNAQGQDEKLINVNIMDVPTPPLNVRADNVFQDNCVVHWAAPKDNGGTDIKKYIVEALDTTSGTGAWSEVAHTAGGGDRQIKVEHLTPWHKYRFRVRAVNKIGPSDPGEMTGDDILMRDPWGEHYHSSCTGPRLLSPKKHQLCKSIPFRSSGSVRPARHPGLGPRLRRDGLDSPRLRRRRRHHTLRHRDEGEEHEPVGGGQDAHRQGGAGHGRKNQGQAGRSSGGLRVPVQDQGGQQGRAKQAGAAIRAHDRKDQIP